MLKIKSENKDDLIINYDNDGKLEEYQIYINNEEINFNKDNENKGKVNNNE
jgi:hypothetical protein